MQPALNTHTLIYPDRVGGLHPSRLILPHPHTRPNVFFAPSSDHRVITSHSPNIPEGKKDFLNRWSPSGFFWLLNVLRAKQNGAKEHEIAAHDPSSNFPDQSSVHPRKQHIVAGAGGRSGSFFRSNRACWVVFSFAPTFQQHKSN